MVEGTQAKTEVFIERVFDAPRELVYKAWTDPEHMRQWWGPEGFTIPTISIDLRTGGEFHFCMRSQDGFEMWLKGVYSEVIEPERVVSTCFVSDEEGNFVTPAQLGMDGDWSGETELVATFEDVDGKTRFTLQQTGFEGASVENIDGASHGWSQSFDKLAEYLPTMAS